TDLAGNEGTSNVANMIVDATDPLVTLVAPEYTRNNRPGLLGLALDNYPLDNSPNARAYPDIDRNRDGGIDEDETDTGVHTLEPLTPSLGQAVFAPWPPLPDGTYLLQARATDWVGNEGNDTRTMIVDTVPPVVTLYADSPTRSATPTVHVSVTDANPVNGI